MNKIKIKASYTIIIIMVLVLLAGSYFGVKGLFGTKNNANILRASEKTDIDRAEDIDVEMEEEKLPKGEKYVLEDDDSLTITVTNVDVSGKTFKQVKKEMRRDAKRNGGIIGD